MLYRIFLWVGCENPYKIKYVSLTPMLFTLKPLLFFDLYGLYEKSHIKLLFFVDPYAFHIKTVLSR